MISRAEQGDDAGRFQWDTDVLTEDNLLAGSFGRQDLVPGFLPAAGLTVVWGPPKDGGKSAFWLRMARRLSQGLPIHGQAMDGPRETIYIATEGTGSLRDRVEGLQLVEGPAPLFRVVTKSLNLFDMRDVDALMMAADAAHLLVIDTLGRLISRAGGDENGADMGRLVGNLDLIREQTSAAIVLVHHGAKDGVAPRGNTSLTGAADTVIKHAKLGDGSRTATVTHARDAAPGLLLRYRLRPVCLPPGRSAPSRTTVVAEELDEGASLPQAAAPVAEPLPKRRAR